VLPARAEATFLPADPPRAGRLAFWGDGAETALGQPIELEIVVKAGAGVRRRTVAARSVAMTDLVDELVNGIGPEASDSVRAWGAATRAALDLVSRGRLGPAASEAGWDCWRVGPLDGRHLEHIRRLAAVLPPAAYAIPVPGVTPLRVTAPEHVVRSFYDAVADGFVRTSAAARASQTKSFATSQPTSVSSAAAWLDGIAPQGLDQPAVTLRLEPPVGADDPFTAVLQVQSATDPSLVIDAESLWDAGPIVTSRFGDRAEEAVLLCLRRGAKVFPALARLLDQARPSRLALDDDEAEDLLGDTAATLAGAGLEVLWPAELTAGLSLRTLVGTERPEVLTSGMFSLDELLEVRYEALLDGHALTATELDQLSEAKRPMIRLRGRFVVVNPALVAKLRARQSMPAAQALALALASSAQRSTDDTSGDTGHDNRSDVVVVGPMAELAQRLRSLESVRELDEPPGLEAELRHYQRRGLAWLVEMAGLGLGGCLADDMGLGKTIQVIAAHLHLGQTRGHQPTLVVCPASLLGNWRREIGRFAPDTPQRRYHGRPRTLDELAGQEIVVTTYGVLRRDQELLAEVPWGLVVADEAQHVKNPFTAAAKALRTVPSGVRFAMTGTPVENRLSELWSLLDWSSPGLLPPLERFQREVAVPIERDRNADATQRFSQLVQPFLLRRRKTDPGIAPELPPKTEADVPVLLSAEQATLYKAVVDDTLALIEEAEGIARQGLVFKLLTALKQICNHPAHYLGQRGPLTNRSGKLDTAEELLQAATEAGESTLVFTQYVAMGHLLTRRLDDLGLPCRFLHGSLGVGRRDELVDGFQAGQFGVFVLSLKAAGTGLNLTRATQVIHYDRWWNPAVEDQASDRAWRIGQDRPVMVHRLVTEGTVEDRIALTLGEKRRLADSVVGSGEAWIAELSNAELRDLLALGQGVTG
jgi:superfamily II DNA or RNA helicase